MTMATPCLVTSTGNVSRKIGEATRLIVLRRPRRHEDCLRCDPIYSTAVRKSRAALHSLAFTITARRISPSALSERLRKRETRRIHHSFNPILDVGDLTLESRSPTTSWISFLHWKRMSNGEESVAFVRGRCFRHRLLFARS